MISIFFFIVHVVHQPYQKAAEDHVQFAALLSLSLTLFGGVVLKTDQTDENMYGRMLISFMLVAMNAAVFCIFVWQTYMAVTKPAKDPSTSLCNKP